MTSEMPVTGPVGNTYTWGIRKGERTMVIGFIGLGNMAKAMISGIIDNGVAAPEEIIGSAKTNETCEKVKKKFCIETTTDSLKVASSADVLILAVKPQVLKDVAAGIKGLIKKDAIVISIAAGRSLADLSSMLGRDEKIVRFMPNTPAMVGAGITAVCPNEHITSEELETVLKISNSCGESEVIPESMMDAFCAVAGSSPAYVFMFLEAMADAAVKAGIPRQKAYKFAGQAVMGSAKLMLETGDHPAVLKDMVCSPGGTTIEAVQVLEEAGLRAAVMDAIEACVEKSKNM